MTTKIFKAAEVDFSKIGFLRPVFTKDNIVLPVFYMSNKKIPFIVQVPSLVLNNSYQGKGYIILPLNGKNNATTVLVNNFFKTLDKVVVDKIRKTITELKSTGKITASDISYRAVVNELEGDDNDVYKNGLIRYRLDFPETHVFDDKKNLIDKNDYQKVFIKGVFIKSIIEVTSLIINAKTGSITLFIKPLQLRIQDETIDRIDLKTYSFFDDDSDNENDCDKHEAKEAILNTQTDCLESEKKDVVKRKLETINEKAASPQKQNTNKTQAPTQQVTTYVINQSEKQKQNTNKTQVPTQQVTTNVTNQSEKQNTNKTQVPTQQVTTNVTNQSEKQKQEIVKQSEKPKEITKQTENSRALSQKLIKTESEKPALDPLPTPLLKQAIPVVQQDENTKNLLLANNVGNDGDLSDDDTLNNVVDMNSDTDNMDENEIKNYFESINDGAPENKLKTVNK